jgi:hypothetical protein
LVDTGSDYCILPIEWVTEYDLTMNLVERTVRSYRTSTGATGYAFRGNLQLKLMGRQHSWPCLFSLPAGVEEHQAEDMLDKILLGSFANQPPPPKSGRSVSHERPTSFGSWLRLQFPDLVLRPGLIGRRGFLEDFELRITDEFMVVVRRSRIRDCLRRLWVATVEFLRRED